MLTTVRPSRPSFTQPRSAWHASCIGKAPTTPLSSYVTGPTSHIFLGIYSADFMEAQIVLLQCKRARVHSTTREKRVTTSTKASFPRAACKKSSNGKMKSPLEIQNDWLDNLLIPLLPAIPGVLSLDTTEHTSFTQSRLDANRRQPTPTTSRVPDESQSDLDGQSTKYQKPMWGSLLCYARSRAHLQVGFKDPLIAIGLMHCLPKYPPGSSHVSQLDRHVYKAKFGKVADVPGAWTVELADSPHHPVVVGYAIGPGDNTQIVQSSSLRSCCLVYLQDFLSKSNLINMIRGVVTTRS